MARWPNNLRIEGNDVYMDLTDETGAVVAVTVFSALDVLKVLGARCRWYYEPQDGRVRGWAKVDGIAAQVLLSRYLLDFPEGMLVDHIDRDPLNNRADNLRVATPGQNSQNRSTRIDSRTGVKGVYIDSKSKSNRYAAAIQVDGRRVHLGRFPTLSEATVAVEVAQRKYHTHAPGMRP